MTTLVQVTDLSKQYHSVMAVKDISFELRGGQVLGLLGHNGAGKSSLIGALLGALSCQGDIQVCGLNPLNQHAQLMQHLAYISDVNILPQWMTVAQILRYSSGVHPSFNIHKAKQLLGSTQIALSTKINSLSKGMKVQLHLSMVMATDTKVLILDEPTLGLDLIYRETFYRQLSEWLEGGERTLIIASHEVSEIAHLLTDILILKQGESLLQGNLDSIMNDYFIIDAVHQQQSIIEQFSPIGSQVGLGSSKWLLKSQYRLQAESLGVIMNPTLQDIFIALQKGEA
ncbi:ABC transporter ATP-binding protein [Psychromonas antarctica]|uniref:ABC transporter ATP-binding protein n=1 Tax=Psychromonas antarctica TaxID=67573 RepID=UPI001EE79A49|nr:ABC transporter ATP-binding protein [Psychromonas antarctica]MCG6201817.1 ABC transporter ATP-binding protein [Psychromonas antarctica]